MKFKRISCLFLSILMLLGQFSSFPVYAADEVSGIFTYVVNSDDTITITGLSDAGSDIETLIIPEEIDGKTVTIIRDSAFRKKNNLIEVTIPDTITILEPNSFMDCKNLKTVNYNANIAPRTSYGSVVGLFRNSPVETINLGEGITSIFNGLAKGVSSDSLTINSEEDIASIGEEAFAGCLASNITFNGKTNIIPDTVTSIGASAFNGCSGITEITIPASVTSIGSYILANCTSLKTVNWNSATAPGRWLGSIVSPFSKSPVETINLGKGVTTIFDGFIKGITSDSLAINSKDNILSIGADAFYGYDFSNYTFNGKTNIIPETVTSISDYAFKNCTSINEITIPASVTSIGGHVFANCSDLKTVNWNSATAPRKINGDIVGLFGNSPVETINLGEGIDVIFDGLAKGITSDKLAINSEEDILSIGEEAFANSSYSDVIFNGEINKGLVFPDTIVGIAKNAFNKNSGITEVTIPNTLTVLENNVFTNCTDLKTVNYNTTILPSRSYGGVIGLFSGSPIETINLGEDITSIPEGLAKGVTSTELTINSKETLNAIGDSSFNNSSLTSINFADDNILSIGDGAFYKSKLETYTIPASVTYINTNAFKESSLMNVYFEHEDTIPVVSNGAFTNLPEGSVIKVNNEDMASIFNKDNYTIGNTTIKIDKEYHIAYKVTGDGSIKIDGQTDTVFDLTITDDEDLKDAEAIPGTGYHFVNWIDSEDNIISTEPILTTDLLVENGVYTAVFEKNSYTVTFNIDEKYGTITNKTITKLYNETIKHGDIGLNLKEGYTLKGWLDSNNNLWNYIVVKKDVTYTASVVATEYNYKINIYYNDELEHTISDKALVDTVIDSYEGLFTYPEYWVFDKTENFPLTVGTNETDNVMNIYYKTDKENYDTYTVEYYYDNVLDERNIMTYTVKKGTEINSVLSRHKDGYEFDKVENFPTKLYDGLKIKVYYTLADKEEYTYTLEYYYNGVLDENKTEKITVPEGTKIDNLGAKVNANIKVGFEYNHLNYVIPHEFSGDLYTVKYFYDNEIGKTEESVDIADIEDKIQENLKDGYVYINMDTFSSLVVNKNGIVIKLFYETETIPTPDKNEYTFSVEYYYDDVLDPEQTETVTVPAGTIIKGINNKRKGGSWVLTRIETVPTIIDKEGIVIKAFYKPVGTLVPGIDSNFSAEYPYDPTKPIPSLGEDFYTEITQNEKGENVINIYYKSDMSEYTINYYFDGVLDSSLTERETVKKGTIISEYPDKCKSGYEFDRVENIPLTVLVNNQNMINVYYKTKVVIPDNIEYKFEYYYDEVVDETLTKTYSAAPGTVISTYDENNKESYTFDKVENLPLTIGSTSSHIIKVYYKSIPDIEYIVEYYFDNVIDDNLTGKFEVKPNTIIETYEEKIKFGYELDRVVNLPLTVTENNVNVIKVYYKEIIVIPENIKYTVEYYFDNVINNELTDEFSAAPGTVISTYEDKIKDGYQFDKVENLPLILGTSTNNIIKVYYKEIVIPKTDYTVKYYFNNMLDDTLTETKSVDEGSVITTYTDKCKNGYELDEVVNLPLTVNKDNDNVIKVYYKEIINIPNKVSYYVEYYFDNIKDNSLTDKFSVNEGTIITSYTDKCKNGYELDEVKNIPLIVNSSNENIIKVYYKEVIVPEYEYHVEYYYNNVKKTSYTETYTAPEGKIIRTYEHKYMSGYEFDKTKNFPLTVSSNEDENIIKVYYVKSYNPPTPTITTYKYTVKYYFDNVIDNNLTETYTVKKGTIITTYEDKCKNGYELDKVDKLPLVVNNNSGVIKVYYVSEDEPVIEKVKYNVEYYYNEVLDKTLTETYTVLPGTVINDYKDKIKTNFVLDRVVNLPLTVRENNENVIKVYYKELENETSNIIYKVEYYFDNVVDNELTDTFEVAPDTVIEKYEDKCKSGYKFVAVKEIPYEVKIGRENIIRVFYTSIPVEKTIYTVEYYFNNVINEKLTETIVVPVNTIVKDVQYKCIEGFKEDRIDYLPFNVSDNDTKNVIRVYYISDDIIQTGFPYETAALYIILLLISVLSLGFILFKKKK